MRDRSLTLCALTAVLAATFAIGLGACDSKPKPLEVTYYYKAGSPNAAEHMADIAGLEKTFPGRVHTRNLEATTDEARRDLQHLEIGTAGVVVRNSNSVLVYKQGETAFDIGRVREAIRGAVGAASP